jgi:decaprenyl-phosphate phosphoribosyltransferase
MAYRLGMAVLAAALLVMIGGLLYSVLLFTVASVIVYLFNDLKDVIHDSQHPKKMYRPIASGSLSKQSFFSLLILLLIPLGIAGRWVPNSIRLTLATYIVINILYSLGMKQIAYWEMFAIASGFVLRALTGSVLVDRPPSKEFFVVVFFGSLFIVISKRLAEFMSTNSTRRHVLEKYSQTGLQAFAQISVGIVLVSYCNFVFSTYFLHLNPISEYALIASILPFTAIMFTLLDNSLKYEMEEPEGLVGRDIFLLLSGVCWLALFIAYSITR